MCYYTSQYKECTEYTTSCCSLGVGSILRSFNVITSVEVVSRDFWKINKWFNKNKMSNSVSRISFIRYAHTPNIRILKDFRVFSGKKIMDSFKCGWSYLCVTEENISFNNKYMICKRGYPMETRKKLVLIFVPSDETYNPNVLLWPILPNML